MNPILEETIYPSLLTANAAGAPTNADSLPTVAVYENGVALAYAPAVANITTGLYGVTIACTAANGFEDGKTYVAIGSAVIGGVTYLGEVATFQVRASAGGLTAQQVADAMKLAPTAGANGALSVNAQLVAIKAKTDLITTDGLTIVSPVNNEGTTVTIIAGDSYKAADGRALTFHNTDWPVLTGATVTLRLAGLKNYTFTVSDASTVTRDFTAAETAMLAPQTYDFVLHAVLSNGDDVTLTGGKQADSEGFTVLPNIPAAP